MYYESDSKAEMKSITYHESSAKAISDVLNKSLDFVKSEFERGNLPFQATRILWETNGLRSDLSTLLEKLESRSRSTSTSNDDEASSGSDLLFKAADELVNLEKRAIKLRNMST